MMEFWEVVCYGLACYVSTSILLYIVVLIWSRWSWPEEDDDAE